MPEPSLFVVLLISLGVIGIAFICFAYYRRGKGLKKAKGPLVRLDVDQEESVSQNGLETRPSSKDLPAAEPPSRVPAFTTVQGRHWVLADLFRALLIVLSLVVALGFIMILLPRPAVDKMAMDLRARYGVPLQERIALLYLGDTVQNNEFRIRGVVRNISAEPIEQLDAAIRFYAHDGTILQTTIVRMDKNDIEPDEIAQFNVVYPDYKREFASYAVEFKLRQGDLVHYKDVRGDRSLPD
jgi:hypothetical protein